jgi:hypothetical protein
VARERFASDSLYAARSYVTAMGGRPTISALIAAEQMARADAMVIALVTAFGKRRK